MLHLLASLLVMANLAATPRAEGGARVEAPKAPATTCCAAAVQARPAASATDR